LRFLILLSVLLGPEALAHSTEGCRGRVDPYRGKPPKPAGTINSGDLSEHLVPLTLPGLRQELKYRGADNVTGAPLYPGQATCWVRPKLAKALAAAAKRLARGGFGLIVYDCYRPWSAQVALWSACPKRGLVGDPARGSHHNRGAAVDLGLIRLDDRSILEMPSDFDDLSHRARHSYAGGSEAARTHRSWLLKTMRRVGLRSIGSEWWHYQLPGSRRFPVLDLPFPMGQKPAP